MYQTPTLATLDATATAASCCRIIVSSGGAQGQITNEPLCPFPAPTPSVCVISSGSPLVSDVTVCVLAN